MASPVPVVLDTTCLPRNLQHPGGAFEVLTQLANAGLVKVYLTEVCKQEWVTQIAAEAKRNLDVILSAMGALTRGPLHISGELSESLETCKTEVFDVMKGLQESVKAKIESLCEALQAGVLKVDNSHGTRVI